jgi:sulfur carrier protein
VIRLRVNGRDVTIEPGRSVLDYLGSLGVDERAVAVELNEEILDRPRYGSAILREGDRVEIVRMVGGGLASP